MYKTKLQEYCQAKSWALPEYSTTKEGYDHCPNFKATVIVNGATYFAPDFSKSSKDAHNLVAKLAFESLTGSLSAGPAPLVSASSASLQQPQPQQQPPPNVTVQVTPLRTANPTNRDDNKLKGSLSTSSAPLVSASSFSLPQPQLQPQPQPQPNVAVQVAPLRTANPTNRDDNKLKGSLSSGSAPLVSASSVSLPQPQPNVAVQVTPLRTANPTNRDDNKLKGSLSSGFAPLVSASSVSLPQPQLQPQPQPNVAVQVTPLRTANPTNRDDNKLKGSLGAGSASLVSASSVSLPQPQLQPQPNVAVQVTPLRTANPTNRDDNKLKDMAHLYKNQLQVYAQKRNLTLPVYLSEREGPPHASRFKSKVLFEGKTYECQEYFCTLKDAENGAAKNAWMSVSSVGIEEEDPGFFKNLLQELAQKDFFCLPEYNTTSSGPSHCPVFISTVGVRDESFIGEAAKTKKLAEMCAAKAAYSALKERAHQKASKLQHVVVQPEGIQNIDKNTSGLKSEEMPFSRAPSYTPASPAQPPSSPGIIINSNPWVSPHDAPAFKKVQVYPREPNMTLPPGSRITHEDERWVAVTMDSIHGST